MNKQLKNISIKRLLGTAFLISALLVQIIPISIVKASTQIVDRNLTLESTGPEDLKRATYPGAVVNHLFNFKIPNVGGGVIKSIKFQYCTTAADVGTATCIMPTGLDTRTATLEIVSGAGTAGFTKDTANLNGSPYITRGSETAIPVDSALSFRLLGVTNPTATINPPTVPSQTFFVRISTYTSSDASGTSVDNGTVAASTNNKIKLSGYMPESLVFCTGRSIQVTLTVPHVPDCNTADTSTVSFNQLFSPTDTASATSQMSASTNAGTGYNITVNGTTMMSGSNSISEMTPMDISKHGVSQFGINLMANTTTTPLNAFGTEVALPSSVIDNLRGKALPGYDTAESFKFHTGDSVANSSFGAANAVASDAQIFTASYIVNVPGSQAAGEYTTTLTYICTPTF